MELLLGDCLDRLKDLEDNSIDAIVTDPPYGLSFMGKKWDYDVPSVDIWKECLRVLKPGGYLLSFAGTRTQHRMAVNIEDAGFEIRDMIAWVYGSGFPKSLNIGKAVDKLQGNEREVSGYEERFGREGRKAKCGFKEEYVGASGTQDQSAMKPIMLPVSEEAKQWEGWGTALKPALEPITVARKPLGEKTVAENVLKWGTGGINIDGCRVGTDTRTYKGMSSNKPEVGTFRDDNWKPKNIEVTATGRFPANLILSYPEDEYVIKSNISDKDILRIRNYFNGKKS
jgi:site-specific DNA-methyltransferase (adenine-specific)